jgi:hypothetical protein
MKAQHSLKKSSVKAPAGQVVKDIRRATRWHFSTEDKIRIVLGGLRGDEALPSCAARKASRRACITCSRRSSWKLASAA